MSSEPVAESALPTTEGGGLAPEAAAGEEVSGPAVGEEEEEEESARKGATVSTARSRAAGEEEKKENEEEEEVDLSAFAAGNATPRPRPPSQVAPATRKRPSPGEDAVLAAAPPVHEEPSPSKVQRRQQQQQQQQAIREGEPSLGSMPCDCHEPASHQPRAVFARPPPEFEEEEEEEDGAGSHAVPSSPVHQLSAEDRRDLALRPHATVTRRVCWDADAAVAAAPHTRAAGRRPSETTSQKGGPAMTRASVQHCDAADERTAVATLERVLTKARACVQRWQRGTVVPLTTTTPHHHCVWRARGCAGLH